MRTLLRWFLVALLILAAAPRAVSASPRAAVTTSAWVSNKSPLQNTKVTAFAQIKVDGVARSGVAVTFSWGFKSGSKTCSGTTDKRGIASCGLNISTAPLKTKVTIKATMKVDGTNLTATTSFTPSNTTAQQPVLGATPTKTQAPAAAAPSATPTVEQPAAPPPQPTAAPTQAAPSNCDASYPDVCIPPPPPDLDCGDIPFRNFRVTGSDPHRFDGDHDGLGCES